MAAGERGGFVAHFYFQGGLLHGGEAQRLVEPAGGVALQDGQGDRGAFDKDAGGKSACNDQCAKIWPPVTAAADAKASGDLSVITRDDGSKQWAYKGKPVYLYAKDTKPGDKTGDNFKDVWHVIKP